MTATEVIWHDIECGGYCEDLPLWRDLAREHGDPILEVGAGTGRVSMDLARCGHAVTALDRDEELLAALADRAAGMTLETVLADARSFTVNRRFALCLVPMQAIQLLGGVEGRAAFLRCARAHLSPGGVLAAALTDVVDTYEVTAGGPAPLPDVRELDGVIYASRPTAVRRQRDRFVIERVREIIATDGARVVKENRIALQRLGASDLEREGRAAGFRKLSREHIPATADYVGSQVVVLGA